MKKVHWIDTPRQIEAMTSSVRHDITDRLAALGPLSARELALGLGRQQTAIYHHLKQLEDAGLVHTTRIEGARGRPALAYETVAPRMRMARAALKPQNREPLARAGKAVAAQAAHDYRKGFAQPHWSAEGPSRNHWFFRVVAAPSPSRLKRINALLDELAELVWTPDPTPGPPVSIAWLMAPVGSSKRSREHEDVGTGVRRNGRGGGRKSRG